MLFIVKVTVQVLECSFRVKHAAEVTDAAEVT